MFLSEWREFLSAPYGGRERGGDRIHDSSRLDVVEIARVPDMLPSLSPTPNPSHISQISQRHH